MKNLVLKGRLLLLSLLMIPALSNAQKVTEEWVQRYDGNINRNDNGRLIFVDGSGNVYVSGRSTKFRDNSSLFNFDTDYTTVKYDKDGNFQWERNYDGPASAEDEARQSIDDRPTAIAGDALGNIYVTGRSGGDGTSLDYATVKYSASGDELWVQRYNGPANSQDEASSIAVDASGNVYVTGYSVGSERLADYLTIKYSASGKQLWKARYSRYGGNDLADAIALDNLGNVYVTGRSDNPEPGISYDFVTIKYSSSGDKLWDQTFLSSTQNEFAPHSIAIDTDNNIFVTGEGITSLNPNFTTIKYDASGKELWNRIYNGPRNSSVPIDIEVDETGNVYVAGVTQTSTFQDYALVKYDASGTQLWEQSYNGPGNGRERLNAITIDRSGNAYVTGFSNGSGPFQDYATVKYDGLGNEIWVQRYNSPANSFDIAVDIVSDDSGNIYVTGSSDGDGTGSDYATIKYSQNQVQEPITLTCPAPQTLTANEACQGVLPDYRDLVTVGPEGLTIAQSPVPGTLISTLGSTEVTLTASDGSGNSASCTFEVVLENTAPEIGEITTSQEVVSLGQAVSLTIPYTDTNLSSALIDWDGDGMADETDLSIDTEQLLITASYVYTQAGVYVPSITLVDACEAESETKAYEFIVIYDPSGGFVTGGGWIESPEGAYAADANLSGKANFGFVSKYKKGATVPSGNTEFQFKAGNLNFNSTEYEWLVIAGSNAKFKGSGSINGAGIFKFMVTADDGETDKFRIKIWEGEDDVIYDNGSQPLGGGSIVVHDPKGKNARSLNNEKSLTESRSQPNFEQDNFSFDYRSYPNPVLDAFNLQINSESEEEISFRVYDMMGRLLHQSQHQLSKGANHVILNTGRWKQQTGKLLLQMQSPSQGVRSINILKE